MAIQLRMIGLGLAGLAAIGTVIWGGLKSATDANGSSRLPLELPVSRNRQETAVLPPPNPREQLAALAEGMYVGMGRSRQQLGEQMDASDSTVVRSPLELIKDNTPDLGEPIYKDPVPVGLFVRSRDDQPAALVWHREGETLEVPIGPHQRLAKSPPESISDVSEQRLISFETLPATARAIEAIAWVYMRAPSFGTASERVLHRELGLRVSPETLRQLKEDFGRVEVRVDGHGRACFAFSYLGHQYFHVVSRSSFILVELPDGRKRMQLAEPHSQAHKRTPHRASMLLSDDTGSGLLLAYGIDPATHVARWQLVTDDLAEL